MTSHEKLIINSEEEKKKKKKKELIININNQQQVNYQVPHRAYIHRSLAFRNTPESVQLLADMEQRARIDGWSFNHLSEIAFREYLERHPVPNPQTQLERFRTDMPAKPSWICCISNCRGKVKYKLELKNFQGKNDFFRVCEKHKRWRHPEFRFLIACTEIWLRKKQ